MEAILPEVMLSLCGDVMTGRGIDQILPHPGDSEIREPYVRSATGYVRLAEAANGPIPAPVAFPYIWGDALAALEAARPDARIVNLEDGASRPNVEAILAKHCPLSMEGAASPARQPATGARA